MGYFNLERRFVERESYDAEELIVSEVLGKRIEWAKVLENRLCLVVAPANFGKTTEMQHQAEQMRAKSQASVFIALRALVDRGNIEKALTRIELDAYKKWKASPTGTLTLFVDSLDEAAAGKTESIGYLLQDLAEFVAWPNERVNWVISTRPAVLTPAIFAKISEILIQHTSAVRTTSTTRLNVNTSVNTSTSAIEAKSETLHLFSMVPLDGKQALRYLEGRHPNLNANELLTLARERGLAGFTKNPGGLDILARIDMLSNPPDSLTEIFNRVTEAIQELRAADHRRIDAGNVSSEILGQAAKRLASASQVCQLVNIEMPPATLDIPQNALSARLIATPTLNETAIMQLLNSHMCIDVGLHQVKIYPDELLPFLAAQHLATLTQSPEQAWKLIQNFTWIAPSGEQGVQREFLPMMGWLATINSHCRAVILDYDPQALAFFGDLRNNSMPLADAKQALTESVRRLVKLGDNPGRGMFSLTSENYWQAGPQCLASTIANLFDEYGEHYAAKELLIDIVTACKSDILRTKVLNQSARDYSRLLQDRSGVDYLLELGENDDLQGLAAAITSDDEVQDSLVAKLLRQLGWSHFTPLQVLQLINKQFTNEHGALRIAYLFEDSDGFLASGTEEQLYQLCRGLVLRVARLRAKNRHGSHNNGRSDMQYAEMTTNALVSLIGRVSTLNIQKIARLCFVLHRALTDGYFFNANTKDLRAALESNTPVRRALLGMIAKQSGLDDAHLLYAVIGGYGSACQYQPDDIQYIGNPRLSKVYEEHLAQVAAYTPPQEPNTKRNSRRDSLKVNAKTKKLLIEKLADLQSGSAISELVWVADWLLHTNPNSRYGEVDFEVFKREVGDLVANAVLQGFGQIWRRQLPRFDEERPRETFHTTIAGLQGLHLELANGDNLATLSECEIRNAIQYGQFEINGYPKWFWPLVGAHITIATSELSNIAKEAVNGPVSKENTEELFTSLSQAPSAVREVLIPLAWKYLISLEASGEYLEEQILHSVMSDVVNVSRLEFERIALRKMRDAFKSPLPEKSDAALAALRSNAVLWGGYWLTSYPTNFQTAISQWGPEDPSAVKVFIFQLAAYFGRNREGKLNKLVKESEEGVIVLEHLYAWTKWAIDPTNDIHRPVGVVYTPGARDDAQSCRDNLIRIIASANSQKAYEIIERILKSASDDPTRMYLRQVMFELRERQFARKPLPQTKYNQFETNLQAEVTDSLSFAMSVHSDLLALKYDIERGEHSLRSFFSELDFKRLNKKGAIGEKAGIALELNFQRLLASELNHHARGRYSVSVESHTGEGKRRDVLCSRNDWRASIELKMSERWTLEKYIEALELQLVGQYMRHRNATTGFLVVVLQTKNRLWTNRDTGQKIDFDELIAILSAKAQSLEGEDRSRYLRIIGIDATTPDDFRKNSEISTTSKPRKKTIPSQVTAAKSILKSGVTSAKEHARAPTKK